MPMINHNVVPIRKGLKTGLAELAERSRDSDLKIIRILDKYRDQGRLDKYRDQGRVDYAADGSALVTVGEVAAVTSDGRVRAKGDPGIGDHECPPSPAPFVSPYLLKPLRTEAQARADRAAGQPHGVFSGLLNWWRGQ